MEELLWPLGRGSNMRIQLLVMGVDGLTCLARNFRYMYQEFYMRRELGIDLYFRLPLRAGGPGLVLYSFNIGLLFPILLKGRYPGVFNFDDIELAPTGKI